MKRLLTVLLTLLMVFSLVGCNSKQEDVVKVDEPVQQEETVKKEEVIVEKQEEVKEEKEEVKEEVKEEKKVISNEDITNMFFWIVTFDQYGNEVDRYTAKYGSTVYDPSTGKAVTVKGNTRFYVNKDYSPSSGGGSSSGGGGGSNPPGPTCSHVGEKIYYISNKLAVSGDSIYSVYEYQYNQGQNKYVYADYHNCTEVNDYTAFGYILAPKLAGFNQGDFVHIDSSDNYSKCNTNGDGIVFCTITLHFGDTHGSLFAAAGSTDTYIVPEGSTFTCYDTLDPSIGRYSIDINSPTGYYLTSFVIENDTGYVVDYYTDGTTQSSSLSGTISSNMTVTVYFKPE